MDGGVGVVGEAQFVQDLGHPLLAFAPVDVGREPQGGAVLQGPDDRELGVQDVVLGDEADAPAQLVVGEVEVPAVVEDRPRRGGLEPGEGLGQRRLSGPGRAQDGDEAARIERERHPVQDRAAVGQLVGEVEGVEGDLAALVVRLELVAVEVEPWPSRW